MSDHLLQNPLLENHTLPPFDEIQAEHVVPAISSLVQQNLSQLDELSRANDYRSVVGALEEMNDRLAQAWSPVSHLNAVVSDDALRDAYNEAKLIVSSYHTQVAQHEGLYQACLRIHENTEAMTMLGEAEKLSEWQAVKHQWRHRDRVLFATLGAILPLLLILVLVEFVFS